jgi:8-oxo-dGTP diphosphatase
MHHRISTEIAGIEPGDDIEAAHRLDALTWIESGAEIFRLAKPATPPKHLVAYFVPTDGCRLLLGSHVKSGLWLPPGGHVEPGEHPRDAARRECREELGIEAEFLRDMPIFITITRTVGPEVSRHTDVSLWYALRAERGQEFDYDRREFSDMRWWAPEDIPENTDPHMHRFAAKLASL